MVPESFDYDAVHNRLVFGSFNGGAVRGFPYNGIANKNIVYDNTSVHTYVDGGTDGM
jgi:hypothetical protein